jgi:hypothetical protein
MTEIIPVVVTNSETWHAVRAFVAERRATLEPMLRKRRRTMEDLIEHEGVVAQLDLLDQLLKLAHPLAPATPTPEGGSLLIED